MPSLETMASLLYEGNYFLLIKNRFSSAIQNPQAPRKVVSKNIYALPPQNPSSAHTKKNTGSEMTITASQRYLFTFFIFA